MNMEINTDEWRNTSAINIDRGVGKLQKCMLLGECSDGKAS